MNNPLSKYYNAHFINEEAKNQKLELLTLAHRFSALQSWAFRPGWLNLIYWRQNRKVSKGTGWSPTLNLLFLHIKSLMLFNFHHTPWLTFFICKVEIMKILFSWRFLMTKCDNAFSALSTEPHAENTHCTQWLLVFLSKLSKYLQDPWLMRSSFSFYPTVKVKRFPVRRLGHLSPGDMVCSKW